MLENHLKTSQTQPPRPFELGKSGLQPQWWFLEGWQSGFYKLEGSRGLSLAGLQVIFQHLQTSLSSQVFELRTQFKVRSISTCNEIFKKSTFVGFQVTPVAPQIFEIAKKYLFLLISSEVGWEIRQQVLPKTPEMLLFWNIHRMKIWFALSIALLTQKSVAIVHLESELEKIASKTHLRNFTAIFLTVLALWM